MAQTTGIFNGTDFNVYVDETSELPIARATSCEISISTNMRDATSKDSGGDSEKLPGLREWSVSTDALYSEDYGGTKSGIAELRAAQAAGTKLKLKFTNANSGDREYAGDAYVESISVNAGMEENVTFSVSFSGTGALTFNVIT